MKVFPLIVYKHINKDKYFLGKRPNPKYKPFYSILTFLLPNFNINKL